MNSETLAQNPEHEIAQLREKVEALMAERVTPAVTALAGQAEDALKATGDTARDAVADVSARVREQPLAAVGLAALVGFAVAALIRR